MAAETKQQGISRPRQGIMARPRAPKATPAPDSAVAAARPSAAVPAGREAGPDEAGSPAAVSASAHRAAPSETTVACKFCGRTTEVCRSRLRNPFEWSLSLFIVPYRCLYCGYRGFALRFLVPRTPANQEILRDVHSKH